MAATAIWNTEGDDPE